MILPALAGTVRPGYKLAGPMYCPSERTAATYFCPNGPNMNRAAENAASVELTMLLVKPPKAACTGTEPWPAEMIDATSLPAFDCAQDAFAMIVNENPIANLATIAINRYRLPSQCT